MSKFFLLLFCCMLVLPVKTFAHTDHLEPIRDLADYSEQSKRYRLSVSTLLYTGFSDTSALRYTVLPAFNKEYAFSIEEKPDGYYIISNTLSQNLWYAKEKEAVTASIQVCGMSKELYSATRELFALALSQKRVPQTGTFGLDGIIYYFTMLDKAGGITAGETWSPTEFTNMHKLITVCDKLYAMSLGKDVPQSALLKEIRQVTELLQQRMVQ